MLGFLQSRVFSKLKGKEGWEGVEVAAYWAAIGKRLVLRDIYGGGGDGGLASTKASSSFSSAAAAVATTPADWSKRRRV